MERIEEAMEEEPALFMLSSEMVAKIFTQAGRFLYMWRTCRHLRTIALATAAEKGCQVKLSLRMDPRTTPSLLPLHPDVYANLVRQFKWFQVSIGPPHLRQVLQNFKNLRSLHISFATMTTQVLLLSTADVLTGLVKLILPHNTFSDARHPMSLSTIIRCTTNLQALDLSHNTFTSYGATQLAESLKFTTSLREIHLSGNHIENLGLQAIVKQFGSVRSLEKLHLADCRLTDQSLQHIAMSCTSLGLKLRGLDLGYNGITSQGLKFFSKGSWTSSLEELVLRCGMGASDESGAQVLASAFEHMPNLRTLDLGGNHQDNQGTVIIAHQLWRLSKLTTLWLETNDNGASGMMKIAEVLEHHPRLRSLTLSHNGIINQTSATAIAARLSQLTELSSVCLFDDDDEPMGYVCMRAIIISLSRLESLRVVALRRIRMLSESDVRRILLDCDANAACICDMLRERLNELLEAQSSVDGGVV